MSFWESKTGGTITGKAEDAFTPSFTIIPDGTAACASIFNIELIEKNATDYAEATKFYQITWKLTTGDFKGRQVTQKIKCFTGTSESIDRNLNMLRLLMDLCKFKPTHSNAPTEQDLLPMVGKILGIKIREWSIPKRDGSGVLEGNFVSEIYTPEGFVAETGVKAEVVHTFTPPESAFTRDKARRDAAAQDDLDSDIPF